jgi:molybdopterin-containing oxidoreductase family iron-sulfur binding subunit
MRRESLLVTDLRERRMNDSSKPSEKPRRSFFRALAGGIGSGAAAGLAGVKLLDTEKAQAAAPPPVSAEPTGSMMVRMQRELDEVIASGRTPKWLMLVDTRKCIGCDSCTVACRAENPTGPAGNFRRVIQREHAPSGAGPWAIFKPVNCLQCDNPPCAKAVPEAMVWKRPDGIVEFDETRLRGQYARAAAKACPFGLIHIDDGRTFTGNTPAPQPYERRQFVENGRVQTRGGADAATDIARKCTFCSHLLDVGVLPACVSTCIGGAMYFGDGANPASLVNELTGGRRIFSAHTNMGLKPRVIYFEESMPEAAHLDCTTCHY